MTGFTVSGVSGVSGGQGLRRKPLSTAKRLQTTVAVLAVVMLFASLLAVVQRGDYLESVAEAPTRDLVNPADTLTSAEAALLEQLARVGDGITLEGANGETTSLDGRFMLAGAAFETDSGSSFSVVTSSWMGAEITSAAEPVLEGDRIVYAHDGLTEWWVRNGRGYEQGWTVDAPPADGSTDLTLDIIFEGAATTQLSPTTVELILGDGTRAWYRNLHAFDAEGTPLPAYLTTQGSQVTVTVEAEGAVYPVTIDPIIDADQEINAPATAVGDRFGAVIATADSLMVVGLPNADRDSGADQGADRGRVELFGWTGATWQLLDTADYPGTGSAQFGFSVDIVSDSVVVVGAPGDDANGTDSGAVFIYNVAGGDTLALEQTVYKCDPAGGTCDGTATGGFGGEWFGFDVGISANKHLVVGAPGVDLSTPGEAFVFTPTIGQYALPAGGELAQLATIGNGDRFGEAVDITESDELVLVGAPGNDEGGATDTGEAWLFNLAAADTYALAAREVGPSFTNDYQYGAAVAIGHIDNDQANPAIAAIGGPFTSRRTLNSPAFSGTVEVKNATAAGFDSVALGDISSAGVQDGFGFSLEVDTNLVIVGRPFESDVAVDAGAVDVYEYLPAGDTMDNGGGGANAAPLAAASNVVQDESDVLGWSVGWLFDDDLVVAGAPGGEDTTNGRTAPDAGYVASWTPGGSTTSVTSGLLTSRADDRFGGAVAINGNRMAVLASGDEQNAPGQLGAVLFYERATELDPWSFDTAVAVPAADTLGSPEPTVVDVPYGSLDMKGNFLVVGMADEGDEFENGAVAVYFHNGTTWVLRDQFNASVANTSVDEYGGFGTDVAITADGDWVAVGFPGADGSPAPCDFPDCGSVVILGWNGGGYDFDAETGSPDGDANGRVGITVDIDQIPGSTNYRVISGVLVGADAVHSWTFDPADAGGTLALEASISTLIDQGESVALDGNRLVAAQSSTASDIAIVADFAEGAWVPRTLTTAELAPTGVAIPNQFVDVVGDYAVVGRADNAGGEVGIWFNDPAHGWGFDEALSGWADGPLDRVQPGGRASGDGIGFSVAAGATVGGGIEVVTGAPNDPTAGSNAGAVYAFDATYTGTAEPANKITSDTIGSGLLGAEIAMQDASLLVAIVAEPGSSRMQYLQQVGGVWSIEETFDYASPVVDVDFASNGNAAVVLENGEVHMHQHSCVTLVPNPPSCNLSGALTVGNTFGGTEASVTVSGSDVMIGVPDGGADRLVQLDFGDGSAFPTGGPAGAVDADDFGFDMDSDDGGDGLTIIGAPGFDQGDGVDSGAVYIYDSQNFSYDLRIDAPAGGGRFGQSVAIDENRLAIGASSLNTDGSFDGAVYIYDYDPAGPTATLIDTLEPSGGSGLSGWGFSVDLDGDVLVTGATGYEEGGIAFRDGSAQVYSYDGASWVETNRLDHPDDEGGDQAGYAVAVVGTDVLVGVRSDDNPQGNNAGAVYSYTATLADPAVANRLLADSATSSGFGRHIDIDGSVAVITEHDGGAMQIYDLVGADWVFRQRIDGFAESVRDVSIDGTRIAVIDRIGNELFLFEESGGTFSAFATRSLGSGVPESVVLDGDDIFVGLLSSATNLPIEHHLWAGGTVAVPTLAGSADAGWSIAKEGNLVFVGARFWDNTPDDNAGRVHIYDTSVPAWTGVITADRAGSLFGADLAASNGRLAVGYPGGEGPDPTGPNPTDFTGIVEVYNNLTPTGADLEQVVTGSNQDIADSFGTKVDIDGDIIAVGAPATSYDGVRRGQVVMFAFDGTSFVEAETLRSGTDSTGSDLFGHDVAVSGLNVIAGAFQHDNTRGTDAGAAYYYQTAGVPIVDDPALTFSLDLGAGNTGSVTVAANGIAVSEFNAEVLEAAGDDGTSIAAAPLSSTSTAGTTLESVPISSLPISSLAADPASLLGSIPLIEIGLSTPGGWPALFEASGSSLADVPINDLRLSDVFRSGEPAGTTLSSTPISSLDVSGTPISSLPISSLYLGGLTLEALSADVDWCGILAGFIDGTCDDTSLTLFEASISGAPISSLPISSLPISSLPISSLAEGIRSLPISSLDLEASPISSLPISSLPISSLPISSLPISSLPISSLDLEGLPISSLPISSLELSNTPISSLPISSLPISSLPISSLKLRNVPISSLPISSLPISSLPISSLPISSLFIAEAPISSLPISSLSGYTDWCEYLADLDLGYDCTHAATETDFLNNTSIIDLGLRGIPISSLPISSLPISSLPITNVPISSLPISSLPISSLPISSLPISSLDLTGTPISSLSTVGATTLAQVPISSLDVAGSPISSLPISSLPISSLDLANLPISSLPISSLPISSLPISSLVLGGTPISSLPISSLDLAGTPISSLPISSLSETIAFDCNLVDCSVDTLLDAVLSGAVDPTSVSIEDLRPYLGDIRVSEISGALLGFTEQDVLDALALETGTFDSLLGYADLTLGELPLADPIVAGLLLGDLNDALWSVRLSDLVGVIIDPTTGAPFANADVESVLTAFRDGFTDLNDLEHFGDVTLGDIIDGETTFEYGDLGPILELVHITDQLGDVTGPGGDLDELTEIELGGLTLLDLIGLTNADMTLEELITEGQNSGALFGFDISDFLLLLLSIDATQFSDINFTEVESGTLPPGVIEPLNFEAVFTVTGTEVTRSVEVTVQIPGSATYIPGSALLSAGGSDLALEPDVDGNLLTWTVPLVEADVQNTITFQVTPTVSLGSNSLAATSRIVGTEVSEVAFNAVAIEEPLESNDFQLPNRDADTTDVDEAVDTLYLTYISSETDNDVFRVDVAEGDELAIQLSSLSADLDFALYGRPTDTTVGAALSGTSDEAPISPITNPDQDESESEPVNDFRRLDEDDPTLQFIAVSNAPGTETELLVTDALPAGTYFIQVYGANGATNVDPAALQVQILEAEVRPNCAAVGAGTITAASGTDQLGPANANTVFLVNQQRMEHYYGTDGVDTVTEVKNFATWLNGPNGPAGVTASVIAVDSYGAVQSAYAAWDADPGCTPESVNGVVGAINGVLDPLRGDLEHLVVVGGDPIIPMARLLDETTIANEYDFRHEFIGDNLVGANPDEINALSASFWDRTYLSDEPYGETAARDLGNRFLYVTDIALGRLVETPAEIEGMLAHFQNFDGQLDAQTAAVLGYDFLVDSSEQIAADLADPALGITVDDELADGLDAGGAKWDKDDAADKVVPTAGSAPDLISLNGHFDHYRALPADGDQVPNFNDNFLADTVINEIAATPSILQGSIIFSMGCHGGLSVSDLQIGDAGDNTNGDWAQAFASDQAIFLGNTGFGYGDTEAVAYTEALLARFAELAVRPTDLGGGQQTTIGQALAFAKNDYSSDLSVFSVYDEKALMEMTFYGLPFYTVDLGTVVAPPVPDNTTAPDGTGIETLGVNADASNDLNTEDRGSFWSNPDESGDPQTIVTPGRPIQPSLTTDVSVVDAVDSTELGQIAHGAVVLGMDSTYQSGVDPVIAAVVFNESDEAPEPDVGDVVFPAKPVTINTSTTPGGQRQSLVLATGQFDSNGSTQRLDDNINAVVYYSDPAETDFDAPTIGVVESNFDPVTDLLTITLTADDTANDVVRVYVLAAADPGAGSVTWTGLDLVRTPGTNEWSGSLSIPGDEVEFLIQAVDSAGNVGFATNKARNFVDDGTEEPAPPAPDLTITVPAPGPEGWYTGPVSVTVDSGDLDATFEISPGGTSTPITGGGFTIDGQGILEWTVIASDGQEATGTVRIDSTAPAATLAPPADGATYEVSAVPAVGYSCADPSLVSCSASVSGPGGAVALAPGDALPTDLGAYTVTVIATDVFNNQATATASYTVVADPLDPLDVTVSPANLDVGTGLYTGDVEVTVVSETDVEYTINGAAPVTIVAPGGSFTITDEGVSNWTVTRAADGAGDGGSVEIDTTAPVVTITAPIDAEIYTPGNVAAIDFECTDANLAIVDPCVATIDGVPIADGDPLPDAVGGPYVVEVTGTDVLGLQTVETASYTVTELTVTVSPDNLDLLSGLYTGPVEVTVDGGGFPTEYTLNGGTPVAIPAAGGTFTITAEEVTEWAVTRAADGAEATGTVEIDTTAPTASLIAPADGADFIPGTVPAIDFDCTDRNLSTCEATVDGAPVTLGAALPDAVGSYDIVVTGTDAVGLTTTATGTYTVTVPPGDPIIVTDIEIDGVAEPGEPVDIWGSFIGGVAPYSISVDWGDAAAGTCAEGTCNIEAPTVDEDGMFDAGYVYPVGGAYTVSVTITDAAGSSVVETLTSATCTITGTNGPDVLRGTTGDDVICGFAGNDRLYGRGGNDIIFGGSGRDRLYGQNGNDILFGGRDNDILYGSFGDDEMSGGRGVDTLIAGDGDDILKGRQDNDWMYGQNHNDTLIGNRGNDRMFGGTGNDIMDGGRGDDRMYGQAGNDMMDGGNGNDLMYGGNNNDIMNGQNGDDDIYGGRGNDTIDGGADSDLCRGNNGTDTLVGCEF